MKKLPLLNRNQNGNTMNQENKTHYHMFCATIVFSPKEGEIGTAMTNSLVRSDSVNVTEATLGQGQQAAQLAFFKKIPGMEPPKIVDVTLISHNYLGYMSEEEFRKPPEGTEKQVVQ